MNSETHSCTHSLASFAILAVEGTEAFIILETFAICVWRVGICGGVKREGEGKEKKGNN